MIFTPLLQVNKNVSEIMNDKKWYVEYKKNPHASMRIFCFPHSGGGASTYFSWSNLLSLTVELISIQLPGRENRFYDHLTNDLEFIIDNLSQEFTYYKEKPFVVFGHSLGALIAYEFVKSVYQSYGIYPQYMIVSGAKAPHLPFRIKKLSQLEDEELLQELKNYGEINDALLQNEQILKMFLPIFRSDFSIGENYNYKETVVFPFDILALAGSDDPTVNKKEILGWSGYTSGNFEFRIFPGGHFFLKSHTEEILSFISQKIGAAR